jgi:predicted RNase H-like HicB family nuclease
MHLRFETKPQLGGDWIAEAIELPGVTAFGQTRDEAILKAQQLAKKLLKQIGPNDLEDQGEHLTLPLPVIVYQIFRFNWKIDKDFGQQINAWLQSGSQEQIERSRFDRQVSLSRICANGLMTRCLKVT